MSEPMAARPDLPEADPSPWLDPKQWRIVAAVIGVGLIAVIGMGAGGRSAAPRPRPMTDCEAAERVFDMRQAEVADGVVSSIAKVRQQAARLRLLGCPGWQS